MKSVILVILLLTSLAVSFWQFRTISSLRLEIEQLRAELAKAPQPKEEAPRLSSAELVELERLRKENVEIFKLRNQVSQLQRKLQEIEKTPAGAQTTAAIGRTPIQNSSVEYSEEIINLDLSKENWTAAGYDSPEASVQTLCGMFREKIVSLEILGDGRANPNGYMEVVALLEQVKEAKNVRIVSRKPLSEMEVEMKLAFDGGKTVLIPFKSNKLGQWKIEGKIRDASGQ